MSSTTGRRDCEFDPTTPITIPLLAQSQRCDAKKQHYMKLPQDGITEPLTINFPYTSCYKSCSKSSYEAGNCKRVFNKVFLGTVIAASGKFCKEAYIREIRRAGFAKFVPLGEREVWKLEKDDKRTKMDKRMGVETRWS